MKKILIMMMVTILAVMSFAPAINAATEADIVTTLKESNILNVYVTQVESWLTTVNVTSSQADQIIALINNVNATTGKKTKLTELTSAQKQSILADFTAAGVVVGLTVEYTAGNITVTNADSQKIFNVTYPTANLIKQTGFDYNILMYGAALIVIAIAAALITRKTLSKTH